MDDVLVYCTYGRELITGNIIYYHARPYCIPHYQQMIKEKRENEKHGVQPDKDTPQAENPSSASRPENT